MSSDLVQKFRSKQDLYQTLAVEFQYHLPVFDECSIAFIREVLAGRKLLFKLSELNSAHVPRLAEFKTELLWNQAMNDSRARRYLPEPTSDRVRPIGRKFLFDVSWLLIHFRGRSSTRSSQASSAAKSKRHCTRGGRKRPCTRTSLSRLIPRCCRCSRRATAPRKVRILNVS